eukprot:gene11751-11897_t
MSHLLVVQLPMLHPWPKLSPVVEMLKRLQLPLPRAPVLEGARLRQLVRPLLKPQAQMLQPLGRLWHQASLKEVALLRQQHKQWRRLTASAAAESKGQGEAFAQALASSEAAAKCVKPKPKYPSCTKYPLGSSCCPSTG